ncbi:TetR/AcrR family transcriptional regulator [Streptomyces sp. NPDC048290]|uniref:TetR/AcrR family transcriptional regulator n=1 Tax=Streptomyces sp. NPDC048290 TaxID=3155811 RepID=UPI0034361578
MSQSRDGAPPGTDGAPQRVDAQRNRERILAVALTELTRDAGTPLSAIAKKACVGQGTLYRHFPNREALVFELYRHEMQQVADAAPELLRTHAPQRALREWMDRLARYYMTKIGLAEAIRRATSSPAGGTAPRPTPLLEAIELLLAANEKAGTVRPGVSADDFVLAIAGLWQIDPAQDWQPRAERLLDLVMRGLSATNTPQGNTMDISHDPPPCPTCPPPTPLLSPPPTRDS